MASHDELVRQLQHVSSELAQLKSHPPVSIASSVKLPLPAPFDGSCDGDTVRNFLDALENWFEMVSMENQEQRARFASTLFNGPARTWFTVQNYKLGTLKWHQLRSDMLKAFRPADYQRIARKQLHKVSQRTPNVNDYITEFNTVFNRCQDVTETEAKFLFEEGLWNEIAMQVYNASPYTLADSQSAAQRAGLVFLQTQYRGKFKNKQGLPTFVPPIKDASYSSGSGSGHAPMVLGNAQGTKTNVRCYHCGKKGHFKSECWLLHGKKGQNNFSHGQKRFGGQNQGKGKGRVGQGRLHAADGGPTLQQQVQDLQGQLATVVQVLAAQAKQGNDQGGN